MHRLVTLGPRVGFVLLLALLAAFAALFRHEASETHGALDALQAAREAHVRQVVGEELARALAVAEARLEALEAVPLADDDGLLLVENGVQRVPRLAGVRPDSPLDEATLARLVAHVGDTTLATRLAAGELVTLPRGTSPLIDAPPLVRLALLASALESAPRREWVDEAGAPPIESLQALVLRAWPALTPAQAAGWCVHVQQLSEQLQVPRERFEAACRRALAATRVEADVPDGPPQLVGPWFLVRREREVRGVRVDIAKVIDAVAEPGEVWTPDFRFRSPALDAAHRSATRTLVLKLLLLAVTALLGVGVVVLARLAERRREQTLAAQRAFVATVSHELRTPLATVRLLAETLERRLPADGPAKDYPHRLVAAADGLSFLVENILSFNRLEAGRWVPHREPFLFSSLEQVVRDDAALVLETPPELHFTGLASMAPHHLDGPWLRLVVLNLFRNAMKYGRRAPVVFSVEGTDVEGAAVLRFTDNGPGIPAAEHERVFEAFHRLPAADGARTSGSGLGLALARRVAELHGGTLRISASSAEGTTFELRLPRV